MPGRTNFPSHTLHQTAVYWGNPVPDGYGGREFDAPVELVCRWEDRQERFVDRAGHEEISRAVVYVDQELELDGYLYLGELDDLSSDEAVSPYELERAYPIRRFEGVIELHGERQVRRAWL